MGFYFVFVFFCYKGCCGVGRFGFHITSTLGSSIIHYSWIGKYEECNGLQIQISTFETNIFHGFHQIPGPDLPVNGTLEGDCTGLFNFPHLGGVQHFVYHPENCSIFMLTTGHPFQSRETECLGNYC